MANGFKHKSMGVSLTQAEYEEEDTGHLFDSQATGDLGYASSATIFRRLGIGSANDILTVSGGIPAWTSTPTLATLTMTGAVDMGNQNLNNVGAAGNDFTSTGIVLSTAGMNLAWKDPTNNGVQGAGGADSNVSVADNETFTFTMGNDAALFYLIQKSGADQVGGCFFADEQTATIVEIADPDNNYLVTDTDGGDNWAVFKSGNSNVISVKNYRNATLNMAVFVLGRVASATAPA